MANTSVVCPICGCLPPNNGTVTTGNNFVAVASDVVVVASTVIASTSGVTLIVSGAGASMLPGTYVRVRGERMLVTVRASNTLTVTRGAKGEVPSGAIAVGDTVTTGMDINGDASHCPICGSATKAVDNLTVLALTTVTAGSQHPIDLDSLYVTNVADANNTQQGTVYAHNAAVIPHAFATSGGKVLKGTQVVDINTTSAQVALDAVTPITLNTVVGP